MIASCGFLENEPSQFTKEEGVTLAHSVETPGVDLRTRVKKLEAKEKATRRKCKVRFSIIKKNKNFHKDLGESMRLRCLPPERLKLRRQMAAAAVSTNLVALVHGGVWL